MATPWAMQKELVVFPIRYAMFAVLLLAGMPALAEESSRARSWEMTLLFKQQDGATVKGPRGGQATFNEDRGGGFSFGYNPTAHFNWGIEFAFNDPHYKARFTDASATERTISDTSEFVTTQAHFTWHLLNSRVTPYVSGGLGWAYIDSNISTGNSYCVPDYYWGWYCYNESYADTDFMVTGTLGLRAEVDDNTFFRFSYGRQRVDFGAASSDQDFGVFKFELGFMQ